jgi:hypothetical protein
MCACCLNESIRHIFTAQIKDNLLSYLTASNVLAPILRCLETPVSLKHLRNMLAHLPTFANTRGRDDHIYGATRYVANTLGIKIEGSNVSEFIDLTSTDTDQKRLWRIANFQCRCQNESNPIQHFNVRNFCQTCRLPIYYTEITHLDLCPVCLHNEPWQQYGTPCISCQLAVITYQNLFRR